MSKATQMAAGGAAAALGLPFASPAAAQGDSSALPLVSVARGTSADSAETLLLTALEGLGGLQRFVQPGMTVAIKPNATWAFPPFTASSTDPAFLAALIKQVRQAGAQRIIVMDHCSIDPGAAEALRSSGIGAVVDQANVEKLFPDRSAAPKSTYTTITLPSGRAFTKIGVIKAALEADVRINLAVPKCHIVTKITQCLKHMMGFLQAPGELHAQLEQGIADINTPSAIQAQLHILEAIRVRWPVEGYRRAGGFETEKTHPQCVRRTNQVVAGTDPALMDAYGCMEYFNVRPQELTHLVRAVETGVGQMDVEQAQKDGRLRFFTAGAALASPTPTPTRPVEITSTPTPAGTPPALSPTHTLPPSSTPASTPSAEPLAAPASTACETDFAAGAMPLFAAGAALPAAAILLGAATVLINRGPHEPKEPHD